jgi:CheY-like chemotaxis protein
VAVPNLVRLFNLLLRQTEPAIIPDVTLLDLNMPKMNGIEFLKILRKDEKLSSIKVFIITTSTETTDRAITHELGISGYIIKPLVIMTIRAGAIQWNPLFNFT